MPNAPDASDHPPTIGVACPMVVLWHVPEPTMAGPATDVLDPAAVTGARSFPPHADWLLGRDPDGVLPLISYRVSSMPGACRPGDPPLELVRTSDHRPHYLTYEGDVSGGRGSVTRAAAGSVVWTDGDRAATLAWHGASACAAVLRVRFDRSEAGADRWRATITWAPPLGAPRTPSAAADVDAARSGDPSAARSAAPSPDP